ncbi:MAG: hypothetical protein J6K98_05850, partial [Clostridia bacterium]|nr:hypothetical protein [Clostridia bacterium]
QSPNQFSIKGLCLSNVTVTVGDESLYMANPTDWIIAGGIKGKYDTDPNAHFIGSNNEALVRIEGIDWTGVTGISLMAGCDNEDKGAVFWKGNPITDIFDCMELGSVVLPGSTYAQAVWSDYVNITGLMSGNEPLYVQSLGRNFNIYALRTTKADLGSLDNSGNGGNGGNGSNGGSDGDSDGNGTPDIPDTGIPFAVIPVALALTAGAALTITKKRSTR